MLSKTLKIEEELGLTDDAEDEITSEIDTILEVDKSDSYAEKSITELNQELDKAVANENYELAAKIRDEISKRS